jgi:diguanylate cyclase (GGDEF)-like protein
MISSTRFPLLTKKVKIAATLGLALFAMAVNSLNVSFSYGVDFVFGSIAVMFAIVFLGTVPAVLAGLAGGLVTMILWGHPYALIIFTAEAFVVSQLYRRGLCNLILADLIYWLLIGMPMILFFYHSQLEMDWQATFIIIMQQPLNGLLNTLITGVILIVLQLYWPTAKNLGSGSGVLRLRNLIFHILLTIVLFVGGVSLVYNGSYHRSLQETFLVADLTARTADFIKKSEIDLKTKIPPDLESDKAIAVTANDSRILTSHREIVSNKLSAVEKLVTEGMKQGRYVFHIPSGGEDTATHLIIEQPAKSLIYNLEDRGVMLLSWMTVMLTSGILLSFVISHMLTRTLNRIVVTSQNFSNQIVNGEQVIFPDSKIQEYASLSSTLKDMGNHLTISSKKLRQNEVELEETIKLKASELTESQARLNNAHQNEIEQIAYYDNLTNLPNRTLLADRLNQTILKSYRHDSSLAVAILDLDDFKVVNDNHGDNVGDELLFITSLRMEETLREGDTLARIGGDEFVLVLSDLTKSENCSEVLERLLLAVSRPVTVGDLVLDVTASIGVAFYPQDDADAGILMRYADQAMYIAKQAGKNCYHLFDSTQDDAIIVKQENLANISAALDRREFVLHYQPKVNMSTGELVGVEALIRWQHPVRGLVSPMDFLPAIENHAISLDIGEWVIDTALSQISQWQYMGITLSISVNLSAYQLQQMDFVERLAALLVAHPDVSPYNLELEILETSALSNISKVSATMQACIDLGVQFALDDFGTGYSSLTYLKRLPASLIKIDQTFIRDMLTDDDDLAIVRGVISLAKAFQLEVIAEGVETIEHGTALMQLGCKLAQGYGIAKPMPADNIPLWLGSWKPDIAWLS